MNWLHPLTERVLAERSVPGNQRRALVLWVNELSVICDQHVPRAPAPDLMPPGEGKLLQVTWILNDRYFAIGITPGLRLLLTLNDPHGTHHQEEPTHQELRTHVQSLFDGWRP